MIEGFVIPVPSIFGGGDELGWDCHPGKHLLPRNGGCSKSMEHYFSFQFPVASWLDMIKCSK
jgi:hypothetical protein